VKLYGIQLLELKSQSRGVIDPKHSQMHVIAEQWVEPQVEILPPTSGGRPDTDPTFLYIVTGEL